MNSLQITDREGTAVEHSSVIVNFVACVKPQLKDSLCRAFSDNVQYKWNDGESEKSVIPDATINCQVRSGRKNVVINAPQFVMEVLSPVTEKYDRETKMEVYRLQEINEFWIVDWRNRTVEIYTLDYDESPKYYLWKVISDVNKKELKIVSFPQIRIDFDELLDV